MSPGSTTPVTSPAGGQSQSMLLLMRFLGKATPQVGQCCMKRTVTGCLSVKRSAQTFEGKKTTSCIWPSAVLPCTVAL